MAVPLETVTDLYGFDIKVNVQAQAIRLQCDGNSRRNESTWAPFVEKNKLPGEHRLKEMVRKVGFPAHTQHMMHGSRWLAVFRCLQTLHPSCMCDRAVTAPCRQYAAKHPAASCPPLQHTSSSIAKCSTRPLLVPAAGPLPALQLNTAQQPPPLPHQQAFSAVPPHQTPTGTHPHILQLIHRVCRRRCAPGCGWR
jgi:hypothetical protein